MTVTIGIDISHWLKGMMLISDHYHEYFDLNGRLIYDPLERRLEQGKQKKEKQEPKKETEEEDRKQEEKQRQQPGRRRRTG